MNIVSLYYLGCVVAFNNDNHHIESKDEWNGDTRVWEGDFCVLANSLCRHEKSKNQNSFEKSRATKFLRKIHLVKVKALKDMLVFVCQHGVFWPVARKGFSFQNGTQHA